MMVEMMVGKAFFFWDDIFFFQERTVNFRGVEVLDRGITWDSPKTGRGKYFLKHKGKDGLPAPSILSKVSCKDTVFFLCGSIGGQPRLPLPYFEGRDPKLKFRC